MRSPPYEAAINSIAGDLQREGAPEEKGQGPFLTRDITPPATSLRAVDNIPKKDMEDPTCGEKI